MGTGNVTVTKRKGRPMAGNSPMTAAQRKTAQRQRDKRESMEAIGNEQKASLRALLAMLGRVESNGAAKHSAQRAWEEIGRRYFVTVTE